VRRISKAGLNSKPAAEMKRGKKTPAL